MIHVSRPVITQSFIFPFTKCHSLSSHSPSLFHSLNVTLCHHTVLHLPIHKVSLSVFTHNPSSFHSLNVTLCIHTVFHLPIHKVSLSVTTQSFTFPVAQWHTYHALHLAIIKCFFCTQRLCIILFALACLDVCSQEKCSSDCQII